MLLGARQMLLCAGVSHSAGRTRSLGVPAGGRRLRSVHRPSRDNAPVISAISVNKARHGRSFLIVFPLLGGPLWLFWGEPVKKLARWMFKWPSDPKGWRNRAVVLILVLWLTYEGVGAALDLPTAVKLVTGFVRRDRRHGEPVEHQPMKMVLEAGGMAPPLGGPRFTLEPPPPDFSETKLVVRLGSRELSATSLVVRSSNTSPIIGIRRTEFEWASRPGETIELAAYYNGRSAGCVRCPLACRPVLAPRQGACVLPPGDAERVFGRRALLLLHELRCMEGSSSAYLAGPGSAQFVIAFAPSVPTGASVAVRFAGRRVELSWLTAPRLRAHVDLGTLPHTSQARDHPTALVLLCEGREVARWWILRYIEPMLEQPDGKPWTVPRRKRDFWEHHAGAQQDTIHASHDLPVINPPGWRRHYPLDFPKLARPVGPSVTAITLHYRDIGSGSLSIPFGPLAHVIPSGPQQRRCSFKLTGILNRSPDQWRPGGRRQPVDGYRVLRGEADSEVKGPRIDRRLLNSDAWHVLVVNIGILPQPLGRGYSIDSRIYIDGEECARLVILSEELPPPYIPAFRNWACTTASLRQFRIWSFLID